MSTPTPHTPFVFMPADAYEELLQTVRDLKADHVQTPAADLPSMGLEPMRVYTAKEAAHFLGTKREQSVYEIPEEELPRARSIGTKVGFLGIHLVCYQLKLPPVDVAGAVEQFRQRLMQDRPKVRALHPSENGKTRVL